MYYYTHLKQDGTTVDLGAYQKKWEYEKLKKTIGGWLELIPKDYYPAGMTGTVYGNEEGRFDYANKRNPHMQTLRDVFGDEWDTVGDLLLEQTEKQFKKWQEVRNGKS